MCVHHFKMYKRKCTAWFCSECQYGDVFKGNVAKHAKARHAPIGRPIGPYPATLSIDVDTMKSVRSEMSSGDDQLPTRLDELSEYMKAHYLYTLGEHVHTFVDDRVPKEISVDSVIRSTPYDVLYKTCTDTKTPEDVLLVMFRLFLGDLSEDTRKIVWRFGTSRIYGRVKEIQLYLHDEESIRDAVIEQIGIYFDLFYKQLGETKDEKLLVIYKHLIEVDHNPNAREMTISLDIESFWEKILTYIPVIHANPIHFAQEKILA